MKSDELQDVALFGVKGRFRRDPHDDGGDRSTAPEESLKKEPAPPAQTRKVVAMGITLLGMCYLVALSSRALSTIHHHYHHQSSSNSSRDGHRSALFGNGEHLRGVDHRRRAPGGEDIIVLAADAAVAACGGGGGGGEGGGAMDEPTAAAAPAPAGSGAGVTDTRRAAVDLDRGGGGGGVKGPQKSADGGGTRAHAAGAGVSGGREAGGCEGKDEGAPQAALPNQGQSKAEGDKGVNIDSGTRSEHFGGVQRRHQQWLTRRAAELRDEGPALPGPAWADVERLAKGVFWRGGSRVPPAPGGIAGAGPLPTNGGAASVEERVHRMEEGVRLWGGTFVPPVEPTRRLELIDKWSGNARRGRSNTSSSHEGGADADENTRGDDAGRILFVMTSFDRGRRLGPSFKKDKLDFMLLMMDEMREACEASRQPSFLEAGFSPNVHLIAAWELSGVEVFVRDRLFCRRTGGHVPYSLEVHPPSIGDDLSIKHRIFMKPRLEEFDVFLQVEDDVIVTLNHILLFREESELLDGRRHSDGATLANTAVPGFIRVEHAAGEEGTIAGPSSGEEWQEWEVMLSRLRPVKLEEAGIYLTLGPSLPVSRGGNNQGMWMATREQLRKLSETKSCDYLNFDESSTKGHVETHSGSLQMFRPNCGLHKVFPASRFESFLVHHRANNKHGVRGESVPGVPISLLRRWVEQFIRDEKFLQPFRNPSKDSRRV
ncbi:unnamed protein product [Ectocarpus sp. 4 AP-2014]